MNKYIGDELELFKYASNWKKYYSKRLKKYIHGDVLEVGAGIGETTKYLLNDNVNSWLCIEPDAELAKIIRKKKIDSSIYSKVSVQVATINEISNQKKYDCILYIDVLEHIKNDKKEIKNVSNLLKKNGYLIILVPAHNFLFSEFDKSVGHYRRYNKKMLREISSSKTNEIRVEYLDSVGLIASIANKILLKQNLPKIKQIRFWDKVIIPISKIVDFIYFYSLGKTVIGIWKKID